MVRASATEAGEGKCLSKKDLEHTIVTWRFVRTIKEKDAFIGSSGDVTSLVLSCLEGSASLT